MQETCKSKKKLQRAVTCEMRQASTPPQPTPDRSDYDGHGETRKPTVSFRLIHTHTKLFPLVSPITSPCFTPPTLLPYAVNVSLASALIKPTAANERECEYITLRDPHCSARGRETRPHPTLQLH